MAPVERKGEKIAYFIASGEQEELRRYLSGFCYRLLDSDAYVSRQEGDIYYITWRDLPKDRILPQTFLPISKVGPRADIFAHRSRYRQTKHMVVHQIKEDGGGVEVAIRAFDHILEGVSSKERDQADAVRERAYEVLDLFQKRPISEITAEEFAGAQRETYALLARARLDPQRLISRQKRQMVAWLLKGETGRDVRDRLNWLVSVGALQAAYRAALKRRLALDPIAIKYIEGREALLLTRTVCREVMTAVAKRLRDQALPSHVLFKFPGKIVEVQQIVLVGEMLRQMESELVTLVSVKPYKLAAHEAATYLSDARRLLGAGKRTEVPAVLAEARKRLVTQLSETAYVYPKEKIY